MGFEKEHCLATLPVHTILSLLKMCKQFPFISLIYHDLGSSHDCKFNCYAHYRLSTKLNANNLLSVKCTSNESKELQ